MGRSQIYQFYFLCEIAHNYALTDRNIREVLNIWKKNARIKLITRTQIIMLKYFSSLILF